MLVQLTSICLTFLPNLGQQVCSAALVRCVSNRLRCHAQDRRAALGVALLTLISSQVVCSSSKRRSLALLATRFSSSSSLSLDPIMNLHSRRRLMLKQWGCGRELHFHNMNIIKLHTAASHGAEKRNCMLSHIV